MFTKVELTPSQKYEMEVARVGFMNACPFFAYYFYSEMTEHPTLDIPTAATDGRRVFYNPEYMAGLKPPERVFVLAHEVYHTVQQHPARMKHYTTEDNLRGHPWSQQLFNVCADWVINADLIKNDIGVCNPAWLFDPNISGDELVEDVYEKWIKQNPPPKGGGSGSARGSGAGANASTTGNNNNPTYGQSRGKGAGKPDPKAQANGGSFDQVLPPEVDPVTGKEDIPDEAEFREAVARAATAAKAMGKLPDSFKRMVDEILEPQISWREHIRMLVTGRIGARHETWDRPNRRRLVLNPMVIMPGRRGFGARDVAVAIDTSGSIGEKELSAFFAEVGGVLADVRPKRIFLIWCDAAVNRVDECSSLDELAHIRAQGAPGGGGTSFIPPFEWLAEHDVSPETLIYLTDGYGAFPDEPRYPVIWAMTTDVDPPFGETVRIKL